MDILKLMLLAEDEGSNPMDGMFSGAQKGVGIVLIVTGLLIIYFAVKVAKGYRFLPTAGGETVVEEDNYTAGEAKVLKKQTTILPDFGGGGEKELTEWEIGYTVGGREYTQTIPDDDYTEGDTIKIKYDPKKPEDFYLTADEETSSEPEDDGSDDTAKSRSMGILFAALGIMVLIGGVALTLL